MRSGLTFFLWVCTRGEELPWLNEDIRRLIWKHAHPVPIVSCAVCGNVIYCMTLMDVWIKQIEGNVVIRNGQTSCCTA